MLQMNGRKGDCEMSITYDDVLHVAKLARLSLSEDEMQAYTQQLNNILKHIEQLQMLDTDHVEPTSHAIPLHNVVRQDKVEPSLVIDKVLLNAPESDEGQFKVPAVLE